MTAANASAAQPEEAAGAPFAWEPVQASFDNENAAQIDLRHAILLYTDRYRTNRPSELGFATLHDVIVENGEPRLGTGVPASLAMLRHWQKLVAVGAGRSGNSARQLLPANMLQVSDERMTWWVPARRRATFLKLAPNWAQRFPRLAAAGTVTLPYPAMVLSATPRRLSIFALKADQRPDGDTVLHHAPVLNMFADASLCWGSVKVPAWRGVDAIPAFEEAAFDSFGTHPNHGTELLFGGGLVALIDRLHRTGRRRFPMDVLTPVGPADSPLTLGRFLSGEDPA